MSSGDLPVRVVCSDGSGLTADYCIPAEYIVLARPPSVDVADAV